MSILQQRAAVILAAGKGTRMKSDKAKVLHPLGGRPLVTYPLDAARAAGAERIVVVTGHQCELVEAAVTEHAGEAADWLRFARQAEQLGTGHAVACALPETSRECPAVMLLSGDAPMLRAQTLETLVAAATSASGAMALCTFEPPHKTGYGRIVREGGRVVRIVEERHASPQERPIDECNAGIYCVAGQFLHDELPTLGRENAQGEVYLTDLVALRAQAGEVAAVSIDAIEAAGVNTLEQLAELEPVLASR